MCVLNASTTPHAGPPGWPRSGKRCATLERAGSRTRSPARHEAWRAGRTGPRTCDDAAMLHTPPLRTRMTVRTPPMSDPRPSFLRGIFSGAIHDALLFPYPESLAVRDPQESRVVARLVEALRTMVGDGLIDSARIDEDADVPDAVLRALGAAGILGITIPREYG